MRRDSPGSSAPRPNSDLIRRLQADCAKYRASHQLAPLSVYNYLSDFELFQRWCRGLGFKSAPASSETISLYVADLIARGRKIATARRHLQGIAYGHISRGLPVPPREDASAVLSGAQRTLAQQPLQKEPLTAADIRMIARACDPDIAGDARDRAIIVLGFTSALRRSNLAALDLGDVEITAKGLVVRVRREKQDRQSKGRLIGLPRGRKRETCPVRCLEAWLRHRGDWQGALFTRLQIARARLSAGWIGEIVKSRVAQIGRNPSGYGGHSMRAGFVTEAGERGVSEFVIAAQTGHRSMEVLRAYFRRRDLWKANAAAMIDL